MAMSDEHRAALKRGRQEAAAIRRYLEAVASRKPGRPVTADSLNKRLEKIEQQIQEEGNPLKAVELEQRRLDAQEQLGNLQDAPDVDELEKDFVKHAKSYAERKGISYAAWRAGGVPAATLKKAGISRSGK